LLIFLSVMGVSIAYFFLKEWAKADLSRNQMKANQLSTELKFLKSQINPHFLFNTLNNLFSMAQSKGNDELADGISKLSGMMRYMIYESDAESVPLTDEIAYIKNSIALNKLRYANDEATVTFDYPDQVQDVFTAPMLFIPFIENAFKHGVLINQASEIDIAITVSGNQVFFSCENKNYSFVKKMDDNASGIGLENVKRRLELVYPGKYELVIKNDADKYAVTLKIDLE
jgi:two-component system LytT family sensor kinase